MNLNLKVMMNMKKCNECGRYFWGEECPYCKKKIVFKDENVGPLRKSILNKFNNKINLTHLSIGGC